MFMSMSILWTTKYLLSFNALQEPRNFIKGNNKRTHKRPLIIVEFVSSCVGTIRQFPTLRIRSVPVPNRGHMMMKMDGGSEEQEQ